MVGEADLGAGRRVRAQSFSSSGQATNGTLTSLNLLSDLFGDDRVSEGRAMCTTQDHIFIGGISFLLKFNSTEHLVAEKRNTVGRARSMLCSENGLLVGERNVGQQPTFVAYDLDLRETGRVMANLATNFVPRDLYITENHVYMTGNVPPTERFPLARATRDLSMSETALGQTPEPLNGRGVVVLDGVVHVAGYFLASQNLAHYTVLESEFTSEVPTLCHTQQGTRLEALAVISGSLWALALDLQLVHLPACHLNVTSFPPADPVADMEFRGLDAGRRHSSGRRALRSEQPVRAGHGGQGLHVNSFIQGKKVHSFINPI